MKRVLTIVFLLFAFCATAQDKEHPKKIRFSSNGLMPDELLFTYTVPVKGFPRSKSSAFLKLEEHQINLFEQYLKLAFSGKHLLYKRNNNYGEPILELSDTSEVKRCLGYNVETVEVVNPETGDLMKQTFVHPMDTSRLLGYSFLEAWEIGWKPFTFRKEVKFTAPIVYHLRNAEFNSIRLYRMPAPFTEKHKKKAKQTKVNSVAYEFFFVNMHRCVPAYGRDRLLKMHMKADNYLRMELETYTRPYAPYFTTEAERNFKQTLFDKLLSGELKAYPFSEELNAKSNPLSVKTIKELYYSTDTVTVRSVEDASEKEVVIETEMNMKEIFSIIFHEDWFVDPRTFQLSKKVKAISPVQYTYDENDLKFERPKRNVLFTVLCGGD